MEEVAGKVIFEGKTEKDLDILIRYPKEEDAKAMCNYINELSQEQTFISFQGKTFTEQEELEVIQKMLENASKKLGMQVLVFSNDNLIAIADINMHTKDAMAHEGTFGMSVKAEYRGKGVGKLLLQTIIDEALKNIPQLLILTLGVFVNNDIAMDMYKKLGFTEFGRLPEGIFHRGQYIDHVFMFKKVK